MIFDYSASWNIFELYIYICIERKRFLLKVSSIIISMGGGIDNARDTYTNSMQFFPGQNRGMEWRKESESR